jgi:hypothetical protein
LITVKTIVILLEKPFLLVLEKGKPGFGKDIGKWVAEAGGRRGR